jgi:hypothetical protein
MAEAIPDKALPTNVSIYDVLKAFAVIIMIVDHVGYYFYPDEMWFRAVGRIGFPVWFFLIGYGRSQRIPSSFWIGGLMLSATDIALGMVPLPLNALFSMAFIRLTLHPLMKAVGRHQWILYLILLACFPAYYPTSTVFEYGTLGFAFAMLGYIVRHDKDYKTDFIQNFGLMCLAIFCLVAHMKYNFNIIQDVFNVILSGAVTAILIYYLPKQETYPQLDGKPLLKWPLQFMGRYTLHIYVAHLVLFKILAFS